MNRSIRLFPATVKVVRSFATASHQPPKKIHGTTGKYASAVYTAASKANLLDKVEGELLALNDLIGKNANFSAFLENPTISRQDKASQISELVQEPKFSHITRNLFLTLAANGRIGESSKVIRDFSELMQASRGAVKVTIISAEALKKKQLEAVQAGVLSLIGGSGKSVEVVTQVEPSILGGLQVMVGDRFLDLSVASRVADLSKSLEAAN